VAVAGDCCLGRWQSRGGDGGRGIVEGRSSGANGIFGQRAAGFAGFLRVISTGGPGGRWSMTGDALLWD